MKTKEAFEKIMESSLFRLNGPNIDVCRSISDLCESINSEEETDWSLCDCLDCSLDSLLVGFYWSLTEWHGGQWSEEYAALCSIGSIFSPGMSCGPEEDSSEETAYKILNEYFESKHSLKGGEG